MKDDVMRIGIIGTGVMARRIADTAEQMKNVRVSAVFSPDSLELQSFTYTFSIPNAYHTCDELLCDEDVDVVYIATPPSHHYVYAKAALEKNKHVICETPFTVTPEQASALLTLSHEKNLFICESVPLRFNPLVKTLHDEMMTREVGFPVSMIAEASFNYKNLPRLKNPELAGGALFEVGTYLFTWTYLVLGSKMLDSRSAVIRASNGLDEKFSITGVLIKDSMAVLYGSIMGQGANKVQICCEERRIDIDNIVDFKKIVIYNPSGSVYKTFEAPPMISGYEYVLEAARQAILDGQIECSQMSHDEMYRITRMFDEFRKKWGVDYPESVTAL